MTSLAVEETRVRPVLTQQSERQRATDYASVLRPLLPRAIFDAQPARLLHVAGHLAIVGLCVACVVSSESWPVRLLLGAVLGHSLGIISFVGHEILHGSVVRGRRLVTLLGGFCFAHWGMLPWVWVRWHNQIHHKHTNDPFADPDCWGKELSYRRSRIARVLELISPGSGTLASYLHLFVFFSVKVFFMVFLYPSFLRSAGERWAARCYCLLMPTAWILAAWYVAGVAGVLALFVVPLGVANATLISYIATNHSLNPLTELDNDCLLNSLTVRSPHFVEWLHLNFNYHVEHHVFPNLSPRFAPRVRVLLIEHFGDRYREMPHWQALVRVYQTPRFYRDSHTLINPRSRATAPTLS